jgi:hypothetical protein
MTISEAGKDLSSMTLAILGAYLFVAQPDASGINNAVESNTTMFRNGIENCVLNSEYTNTGNTSGTAREVTIIIATTVCSLPPTKFTIKGAPSPVEIPESNNTDRDSFE